MPSLWFLNSRNGIRRAATLRGSVKRERVYRDGGYVGLNWKSLERELVTAPNGFDAIIYDGDSPTCRKFQNSVIAIDSLG